MRGEFTAFDGIERSIAAFPAFTPSLVAACTCSLCHSATGTLAGAPPPQPFATVVRDYTALVSPYSITNTPGTGAFQSYSFPTSAPAYLASEHDAAALATFAPFSASEQALAREAIALLGAATGLTFFEVAPGEGDIKFMIFDVQQLGQGANTAAFAYYPVAHSGNFTIPALTSDTFFDPGRATFGNILHELGHAVGLKHPFEGNPILAASLDNTSNTVMSYTAGLPIINYLTLDVLALQYLYGGNRRDGSFISAWSWDQGTLTLTQTGNNNSESIRGIGGRDIISALGGTDRIFAGEGDDSVDAGSGDDDVFGAEGNDRLDGGAGQDTLRGGPGNDTLIAADGRDFLFGDDGDDLFRIATAAVWQVSGGSGQDTVSYEDQPGGITYTINANRNAGGITETHTGIESAIGSAHADTLTGTAQDNRLTGLGGDDRLSGGGGNDLFVYTARRFGADTITDFNAGDRIDLSALGVTDLASLAPFLVQSGANAILTLGYGGTAEAITFNTTQISALAATGFIFNTDPSPRTVTGTTARDVLFGGNGDDQFEADAGDDALVAAAGNDRLNGGTGTDNLYGGTGDDTYYVDVAADLIFEAAGEGDDLAIASAGYYLWAHVERLLLAAGTGDIFGVGNTLDNTLTGNEARNLLIGGSGNDTVFGANGNDALFGEAGNDTLNGDSGIDYLVGGDGNDTLDGGAEADALYGESGDDTLRGGSGFDTDILVGGDGDDTLDAASGRGDYDLIDGGAGNDVYYIDTPADLTFEAPGGGTDTIVANINGGGYYLYANTENLILEGTTPFGVGNELANSLIGNGIGNYLLGGQGNDSLNGKQGNDVLFGESGTDLFVFERGTGGDVIGDFQPGTDKIQLLGLGFATYAQLTANFVEVAGTTAINLGQGDLIVINGVANAALSSTDFILG